VYRYASVAYVGGGFGVGIHNILEAATYGVPVVFGPKFQKFKEARDLVDCKGAFSIKTQLELNKVLDDLLINEENRKTAGAICGSYVKENLGATSKILSHLKIDS
jgi:3-deoxy-D-manno-octulosonic-acid transferase